MKRTLKIAFSLKNTYRVNTILYSLKQIPLIKSILPQELYCDPDIKIFTCVRHLGSYQGISGKIPVFSSDDYFGGIPL